MHYVPFLFFPARFELVFDLWPRVWSTFAISKLRFGKTGLNRCMVNVDDVTANSLTTSFLPHSSLLKNEHAFSKTANCAPHAHHTPALLCQHAAQGKKRNDVLLREEGYDKV